MFREAVIMFSFIYPDAYESSIYDIPYGELKSNGLTNILFDIDNTVAPVGADRPGTETEFFFCKLGGMGFKICLLSNGKKRRVGVFAESLGVPYVAKAGKPFAGGLDAALNLIGADRENSVIIGDQIFTDVLCGRRNSIYTILVRPISKNEEWYVRLKRVFERPVMSEYLKKRGYAGQV